MNLHNGFRNLSSTMTELFLPIQEIAPDICNSLSKDKIMIIVLKKNIKLDVKWAVFRFFSFV